MEKENFAISVEDWTILSENIETLEIDTKSTEGQGSVFSAFFNILNTTLGAGLLSIPFAFKAGIILGPLLLLLVISMSVYFFNLVLILANMTGKYTYKEISYQIFRNKPLSIFMELVNLLFCFGGNVGYLVIIGDLMSQILKIWIRDDSVIVEPWLIILVVMVFIIFPLCCLRRISFLSYTSSIAVVIASFVIVCVCFRGIQHLVVFGIDHSRIVYFSGDLLDIFQALPILFFSYGSIVTVLPAYLDMKNRSTTKMSGSILSMISFAAVLYYSIGFLGYFQFYEDTPDNVLTKYGNDDILLIISKIAICTVLVLSFPIFIFICRDSTEKIFFPGVNFSWARWILQASIFSWTAYLLAIAFPSISSIFGLSGAIGGVLIIYVFPGIMYIRLSRSKPKKIFAICLVIFASCLGVICTGVVLYGTYLRFFE